MQLSQIDKRHTRVFMPVRTSRSALILGLTGALAGALIQVPYARTIGYHQWHKPYFFFLIFGVSTFASLGCMTAMVFGASLSRRVCWLFGLACGYVVPEVASAIVVKIDDVHEYYSFQMGISAPLRLFCPLLGFAVGLLASLYQRGMTRKSARAVLRAILYVVPLAVMSLLATGDRLKWRIDESFEAEANSLMIVFGLTFIVACILSVVAADWAQERAFPMEPVN